MSDLFVDLVGGNDSNNGTSFPFRKLTLDAASTVAGPGDRIKIMKSPDPYLVNASSTWTNNSDTVLLPTGTIVNISSGDYTIDGAQCTWSGDPPGSVLSSVAGGVFSNCLQLVFSTYGALLC